jgi:hypothetical protein
MQFSVELANESLPVYVDAVELRQVIINLVLNAIDAMPQTGRLLLRTAACNAIPPLAHVHGTLPRTPAACLSVEDTGCGIKPRHLASIFDPFFTTKPMNKGSGLGLYNARFFVEKHHGAISVDSKESVGSTLQLWLPQADFSETDIAPRVSSAPSRRSLLLVGPEGDTLDGTAELLRVNSYHVATAVTPDAAREALRSIYYSFGTLFVLAEPNDTALVSLLADTRRHFPDLKLVLKLIGQDQDDLPPELVRQVDLLIAADMPQTRILETLAKEF